MRKIAGVFVAAILVVLSCTSVFAGEYMVTLKEGVAAENLGLTPLIEDIGLYTADEETARALYAQGKAASITEDKPLVLPDEEPEGDFKGSDASNPNLRLMSDDYNDAYYSEEIYFGQNKIKEYIDTYSPSGKVRIAVIDTGVNRDHRDFIGADIEEGYNFVTSSTDTADLFKHGTMVTSIIAAGANDGVGVAGIAPNATIVPLVVLTKVDGEQQGTSIHLLKAIKAAVDTYNCKIISASLGATSGESEINAAVRYAIQKGVIVISAAGNDGGSSDPETASALSYPASSPNAVSVGATDKSYNLASYSQKNTRVDVVTCGGYFTMPSNSGTDTYSTAWGTSFSAPVITGITALFVSLHPDITPKEYRRILKGSAMDIGESGSGDYMGGGMPDCMAMERMYNDSSPVFIAPVYEGDTRNVKLVSDGTVFEALLICVSPSPSSSLDSSLLNGIKGYSTANVTFDDENTAYIALEAGQGEARYFAADSLSRLRSLSYALDFTP